MHNDSGISQRTANTGGLDSPGSPIYTGQLHPCGRICSVDPAIHCRAAVSCNKYTVSTVNLGD